MLLLLTAWAMLLALCLPPGVLILHFVGADDFAKPGDRFFVSAWLGLSAVSALLLAVAHLAPLSPVGLPLMLAPALPALLHTPTRRKLRLLLARPSASEWACVLALSVGAAVYNTLGVYWYDTGLYHYGAVRWLSRHGVARGIALFQPRFGIASTWFATAAAFDFDVLETRASTALNGFALLLASGQALLCLRRLLKRSGEAADLFLLAGYALMLPLVVEWEMPVSLAPLLPATILILVVSWTFLVVSSEGGSLVPVILALAAASFKLNAAPLAVVACVFYLSRSGVGPHSLKRLCLTGLLMFAPVVAFQLFTAGYPLFPLTLARLPVPWAVSLEETRLLSDTINSWARWHGLAPHDADGLNWLWRGWLPFGAIVRSRLFYLSLSCLLVGVALTKRKRAQGWALLLTAAGGGALAYVLMFRAQNFMLLLLLLSAVASWGWSRGNARWALLSGVAGMLLVLFKAPDVMYGLGCAAVLWACFAVGGCDVARALFGRAGGRVSPAVFLLACVLILGMCRLRGVWEGAPADTGGLSILVAPPRLPHVATERVRVNDFEFFRPVEGNQCWAAPLPCTSGGHPRDYFHMPEDIRLLDPPRGVSAGFGHRERSGYDSPDHSQEP